MTENFEKDTEINEGIIQLIDCTATGNLDHPVI